jgi:hypothetical protein
MKTLSRTFRFVVLGVIVMVVVISCCDFPSIPGIITYCVELGNPKLDQYVNWKQPDFDNALIQLGGRGGTYCLKVKLDDGTIIDPYHPKGYKDYTNCSLENIRTVKVTKSKVADNTANGQSAVNDPNAFYRVRSPNPDDIKKVVAALATPTPMPTH